MHWEINLLTISFYFHRKITSYKTREQDKFAQTFEHWDPTCGSPKLDEHQDWRWKCSLEKEKENQTIQSSLWEGKTLLLVATFLQHCSADLIGAHRPASILSTAKFGGAGQLASLQCQLSFPGAAGSILSAGSDLLKVQSTGCIWGLSLAHFPSMNELFL